MHDIKAIRDNPEAFDRGLARRGLEPLAARLLALDETRRTAQTSLNEMQARRNAVSREIGAVKKQGGDAQALMDEVATLKDTMAGVQADHDAADTRLREWLAATPNLPGDDVPDGPDEDHNVEMRRWGEPRAFDFEAREHADIGPALGMDFETATRESGARFVILRALWRAWNAPWPSSCWTCTRPNTAIPRSTRPPW